MINDMLERIYEDAFQLRYSLYADDVTIWSTNKNVNIAVLQVQKALNRCQDWCAQWGLQISAEKSTSMLFTRKNCTPTPTRTLQLDGFPIPIVPTQKYLGLLLDSKLNFGPHVDSIRNRCLRRLNILRCIAGQNWGAELGSRSHNTSTLLHFTYSPDTRVQLLSF